MAHDRKALGRGLSALISDYGDNDVESSNEVVYIPLGNIIPNPKQPRRTFNEEKMEELTQSVRKHGVIQPILIAKTENVGKYQIIAGERRWRAATKIGHATIPCLIREYDKNVSIEVSIIENIQRDELNPIEQAKAYKELIEAFKYTQENLAENLGKNRSSIANTLRLLSLPEEVQVMIEQGILTVGHGKCLIGNEMALEMASIIAAKGLNVRQAEKLLQDSQNKPLAGKADEREGTSIEDDEGALDVTSLEASLHKATGMKVKIRMNKGDKKKGQIMLKYQKLEELDALLSKLFFSNSGI
jgi:ParB family chromosome partitioning protein